MKLSRQEWKISAKAGENACDPIGARDLYRFLRSNGPAPARPRFEEDIT
jgi:hypothetical protein